MCKHPTMTRPPVMFTMLAAVAAVFMAACTSEDADTSPDGAEEADPAEVADTPAKSEAEPPVELSWSGCTEGPAADTGLECTSFEVPVNRKDPDGERLELALARQRATGPEGTRIGALLVNPGGPGASGIDYLANNAAEFPGELRARFDIVSWDPRGVGQSSPVQCLEDEVKDEMVDSATVGGTPEATQEAVEDEIIWREGCLENNPVVVEHMSTADTADDLEDIRIALDEGDISFLGISYGTAVGATYATLYPGSLRAMVLDSPVMPAVDDVAFYEDQLASIETLYSEFVESCDSDPTCPATPNAAATVDRVRGGLVSFPLNVETDSGNRILTRDLFDAGLITALYDPSLWGSMWGVIAEMEVGGPGNLPLILADQQLGRLPDGTWDNSRDAMGMVLCADSVQRSSTEEALDRGSEIAESAGVFSYGALTQPLSCHAWPMAANPVPEWTAEDAPGTLVIGTASDPATPYEWAVEMDEALAESTLVTHEGKGHPAFLRGNNCIDNSVVDYLLSVSLPEDGQTCPAV